MSFASDVKNEICKMDTEDICCVRAELAGMVCFAAQITAEGFKINTENPAVSLCSSNAFTTWTPSF